jgi:general secretion pathway protein J
MSFLTRICRSKSVGFTLLEMLVVVLLISLLASLLMQGFIYTSGIYKSVERRQGFALRDQLLNGWLRDSIHGLVNGADGRAAEKIYFSGNQDGFSGISLGSLTGRSPGLPVVCAWSIERTSTSSLLVYTESSLYGGGEGTKYIVREWSDPQINAHWQYLQDGEWRTEFPVRTSVFKRDDKNLLPRAIALYVDTLPVPLEIIISVRSSPIHYAPPTVEGIF